jgi:hypothetical protein
LKFSETNDQSAKVNIAEIGVKKAFAKARVCFWNLNIPPGNCCTGALIAYYNQ